MIDAILTALGFEGPGALLAVIGATIAAVFGVWFTGRRSGAANAERKAKDRDNERARQIEDAADQARANDGGGADPVERVRRHGRIRD